MIEAGIEPKERALAEARHKLAAADQTLEEKHGLLRKVDDERQALVAGGTNPAYGQALETICVRRQQGRSRRPLSRSAADTDER